MWHLGLLVIVLLLPLRAHTEYLGNLSANPYNPNSTTNLRSNHLDPNSASNPIGRYGSSISPDSLNNPVGAGNPLRSDSPGNPYGSGWRIERNQ